MPQPVRPTHRFWPALPNTERQRVRWFVAGHVLAVWLLFQLATLFGDGHAPSPFPPDLSPTQRAQALALQTGQEPAIAPASSTEPVATRGAAEPTRPLEWSR